MKYYFILNMEIAEGDCEQLSYDNCYHFSSPACDYDIPRDWAGMKVAPSRSHLYIQGEQFMTPDGRTWVAGWSDKVEKALGVPLALVKKSYNRGLKIKELKQEINQLEAIIDRNQDRIDKLLNTSWFDRCF